jgi:hypothetical protein
MDAMRRFQTDADIAAARRVADRYIAPASKKGKRPEKPPRPGMVSIDRQHALALLKDVENGIARLRCPGARGSIELLRRLLWA